VRVGYTPGNQRPDLANEFVEVTKNRSQRKGKRGIENGGFVRARERWEMLPPGTIPGRKFTSKARADCARECGWGQFHAIDNTCIHRGGPLADGSAGGKQPWTCPWHGWEYDVGGPAKGRAEIRPPEVDCYAVGSALGTRDFRQSWGYFIKTCKITEYKGDKLRFPCTKSAAQASWHDSCQNLR